MVRFVTNWSVRWDMHFCLRWVRFKNARHNMKTRNAICFFFFLSWNDVHCCLADCFNYTVGLGCRDFQKCGSHFKILGAGRVTLIRFCTNDSQTLGATVENLVSTATWRPGFVHPCSGVFDLEIHIFITRAATAMVYWHHIFWCFQELLSVQMLLLLFCRRRTLWEGLSASLCFTFGTKLSEHN